MFNQFNPVVMKHLHMGHGITLSECIVHIYWLRGGTAVLLEDVGIGTRVNIAIEQLANEIIREMGAQEQAKEIVWLERDLDGSMSRVTMTWSGGRYVEPRWTGIQEERAVELLAELEQRHGVRR